MYFDIDAYRRRADYLMPRALVTGATGFVGAAVTRLLLSEGYDVNVLIRASSNQSNIVGLPVQIFTGDLNDRTSIEPAATNCQAVFHVAADYRLWVRNPDDMNRTNINGSKNVIYAAMEAGAERIVYTSSVATLATSASGEPADEDTPNSLDSVIGVYKRSKFMAEAAVSRMVTEEAAPVVIVNPSTPVGPGDIKPTPTGRMIVQAAKGKMPAYVDTGLNIVHVDDVAQGHMLALLHGKIGERYILGGENMTLGDILGAVTRAAGVPAPNMRLAPNLILPIALASELLARVLPGFDPFVTVDGLRMSKKKMYFSSGKAERELGYTHRSAKVALADAVEWFRQNGYLT